MSTITGTTYITDLAFVTTATTEAVLPIVDFDGAPSGVTLQFPISAITTYNLAQNTDELGGTSVRTLFASTTPVVYDETADVDLLSGGSSNFGSINLPTSFFGQSGGYLSKKISFDIKGVFGSGSDTFQSKLQIGGQVLSGGSLSLPVAISQPDNHPFEILGNLTITSGQCYSCISIRYCDNSGGYQAYNLSDLLVPDNITSFTGGDIQFLIVSGGTGLPLSGLTSIVQIHN
jgi:hypothetical protein